MTTPVTLTSLAHGGGCGCKLSPGVLRDILSQLPASPLFSDLIVGTETSDDAAAWRLNEHQVLVATTDFFTPIVDDPYDFGRIAAANALSDIYAMGAQPLFALAIVGMPIAKLPPETIGRILAGGVAICASAGIPVAGGHSIDAVEPIYGLVVIGVAHPSRLKRNSGGQVDDVLVLTKALGVGVFSAALKQGKLDASGYAALIASTTQLNLLGPKLAEDPTVHAITDVTGFGLLGHTLEMCRGANLSADIIAAPPLLKGVEALASAKVKTGAASRNWASYREDVVLKRSPEPWRRDLLCDPQTSGGLLVAVHPNSADKVVAMARSEGFNQASIIGRLTSGPPQIRVGWFSALSETKST